MDPKDRKPEMNPGDNWEQDLESVRSALPGLESVEPPDLLDQAVLNTARRELAASSPKPVRWPMRWVGAFATATVVVLALSIVIQQDPKTPDPRSGNGITLDAVEADYAAKKAMQQVSKESGYRPVDKPDLPEIREQFEDGSLDVPVTSTRDNDVEEETAREASSDFLRIDSNLLEKTEDAEDKITLTPDAWIEYMIELQKTEQHEELKSELEAFRKAYPDYPLPAELRD